MREREKTILETIPASATGFSGDAPLDPSTTTAVGRDRPPINANSLDSEYHQSLQDAASIVASVELYFSPSANTHDDLNGTALEWYDLLAQDAITNFQRDNVRHFDENTLSRRQSPAPNLPSSGSGTGESRCISAGANFTVNNDLQARLNSPPWNTEHRILLDPNESSYMQYYVNVVGPILDLLDPSRNFSEVVPHLAMYNVGLLKSLLAIAARHMALHDLELPCGNIELQSTPSDKQSRQTSQTMATQYYYETLQYLSQNLLYPSYSNSLELISTAILISTYEMFDTNDSARNGNWERHLRGCFWIQRTQDNDGEMMDRLRRAIWWAWIRQDTWAAFRAGRRTFTIFKARKRLESLTADELATRIFLIAARCVDYAASSSNTDEVAKRLERGEELLGELGRWHAVLPASFKPILTRAPTIPTVKSPWATAFHPSLVAESNPTFAPIWIHPPAHAAAIQMYNFARIIVLLHQPSTGGLNIYAKRQKMLDECVDTICGIATAQQGRQLPIALVNAQALFTGKPWGLSLYLAMGNWSLCAPSLNVVTPYLDI